MRVRQKSIRKAERLLALLKGKSSMLIVMQDYPDPDAIAAATAMRALANARADIQCSFAHGGTVGRAENRASDKKSLFRRLSRQPEDTA